MAAVPWKCLCGSMNKHSAAFCPACGKAWQQSSSSSPRRRQASEWQGWEPSYTHQAEAAPWRASPSRPGSPRRRRGGWGVQQPKAKARVRREAKVVARTRALVRKSLPQLRRWRMCRPRPRQWFRRHPRRPTRRVPGYVAGKSSAGYTGGIAGFGRVDPAGASEEHGCRTPEELRTKPGQVDAQGGRGAKQSVRRTAEAACKSCPIPGCMEGVYRSTQYPARSPDQRTGHLLGEVQCCGNRLDLCREGGYYVHRPHGDQRPRKFGSRPGHGGRRVPCFGSCRGRGQTAERKGRPPASRGQPAGGSPSCQATSGGAPGSTSAGRFQNPAAKSRSGRRGAAAATRSWGVCGPYQRAWWSCCYAFQAGVGKAAAPSQGLGVAATYGPPSSILFEPDFVGQISSMVIALTTQLDVATQWCLPFGCCHTLWLDSRLLPRGSASPLSLDRVLPELQAYFRTLEGPAGFPLGGSSRDRACVPTFRTSIGRMDLAMGVSDEVVARQCSAASQLGDSHRRPATEGSFVQHHVRKPCSGSVYSDCTATTPRCAEAPRVSFKALADVTWFMPGSRLSSEVAQSARPCAEHVVSILRRPVAVVATNQLQPVRSVGGPASVLQIVDAPPAQAKAGCDPVPLDTNRSLLAAQSQPVHLLGCTASVPPLSEDLCEVPRCASSVVPPDEVPHGDASLSQPVHPVGSTALVPAASGVDFRTKGPSAHHTPVALTRGTTAQPACLLAEPSADQSFHNAQSQLVHPLGCTASVPPSTKDICEVPVCAPTVVPSDEVQHGGASLSQPVHPVGRTAPVPVASDVDFCIEGSSAHTTPVALPGGIAPRPRAPPLISDLQAMLASHVPLRPEWISGPLLYMSPFEARWLADLLPSDSDRRRFTERVAGWIS